MYKKVQKGIISEEEYTDYKERNRIKREKHPEPSALPDTGENEKYSMMSVVALVLCIISLLGAFYYSSSASLLKLDTLRVALIVLGVLAFVGISLTIEPIRKAKDGKKTVALVAIVLGIMAVLLIIIRFSQLQHLEKDVDDALDFMKDFY